jgi:hypothetical protein
MEIRYSSQSELLEIKCNTKCMVTHFMVTRLSVGPVAQKRLTTTALGKGKGHPMTCLCSHRGEAGLQLQPIRNLGPRKGRLVSTKIQPFYPRGRAGTHCTGGGVGLGAGFRTSTVQPVASRYTDCTNRPPFSTYT